MQDATERAERTVAIISPAFFESPFCRAERAAAFVDDPVGEQRKLIPVRVSAINVVVLELCQYSVWTLRPVWLLASRCSRLKR